MAPSDPLSTIPTRTTNPCVKRCSNSARERLPEWTDHSPNDLGVLLVELFAYMGDIMLYYQDRIADESYLDTAVERRSIVRLLRLLGYELRSERPASADLTLVFEEDCTSADIIPGTAFETSSNATGSKVRFEYVRPETLTIVQPPKDLKDRWETRDGKQNVLALPCASCRPG